MIDVAVARACATTEAPDRDRDVADSGSNGGTVRMKEVRCYPSLLANQDAMVSSIRQLTRVVELVHAG